MDREIIFIGRDDADGHRAARLAAAVGVHNVGGILAGGMTNWRQERQPVARASGSPSSGSRNWPTPTPSCRSSTCARPPNSTRATSRLDLRAVARPARSCRTGVDAGRPIATICAGGVRAGTAASLLALHGAERIYHVVDGGVKRWPAIGKELVAACAMLAVAARPARLISAGAALGRLADPDLRVFDATQALIRRPAAAPTRSGRPRGLPAEHIPGAAFADVNGEFADPVASTRSHCPAPSASRQRIREQVMGPRMRSSSTRPASRCGPTRLWWLFRVYGFDRRRGAQRRPRRLAGRRTAA